MMIRRRIPAALAVTTAAALLLTACGRSDVAADAGGAPAELTEGAATGTVTIWAQGTEGEALQDFVAPFEEENPDVEVRVTAVPWDSAQNKYQTAVAGGTTPDIGMLGSDWMPTFRDALSPLPEELDTSGVFPFALQSTEFDGQNLAMPWYVETRVIYYRSDLMAQAGFDEFPTDWDGFKELARAYQEKAGAEFGMNLSAGGWNSFLNNLPFAWSNGAAVMDDGQTAWTFDSPQMVDTFAYLNSFYTDGIADPSPQNESGSEVADLVSGRVPMFISGPWNIPGLEEAGGAGFEDAFDVAPMPAGPDGTSTSFAAGANLGVFKNAENPDAAWKLVEWLSRPDVQTAWFETVNDLPAQQSSWEDDALTSDPRVQVFGTQLQSVEIAPTLSTWPQVSAAGDTQIEQIFRGGKSPQDAMAELQATADSLGTGQ